MKKTFGILLALLFLAVQTGSVLHMAEHGFAEHKHHGHTCDIFLYYTQGQDAGSANITVPVGTSFIVLTPLPLVIPLLVEAYYLPSVPRAPPAFA